MAKRKQSKMVNRGEEEKEKEKGPEPNLDCLEVDITEPLSKAEWTNLAKVIEETQGFGWFQILPVG